MTKLISKKPIFESGFFTVYEDQVKLKTGINRKYFSAKRVPAVSVFPLNENNEIYLIKEYRYLHKKTLIETVAGTIDKGEEPIESAKRELLEEAGIKAGSVKQIGKNIAAGSFITWDQYLFLARDLAFEKQKLADSEEIEVFKLSLSEAVEMVLSGKINTATTSFGILLIDNLIKKGKL